MNNLLDNDLVQAWLESKVDLDIAKATELDLRNQLTSDILNPGHEGAVKANIESGDGNTVTATGVINRKLDTAQLALLMSRFNEEDKACVEFKPSLIVGAYKKLPETSILRRAVIATPGQSQLKYNYAKVK